MTGDQLDSIVEESNNALVPACCHAMQLAIALRVDQIYAIFVEVKSRVRRQDHLRQILHIPVASSIAAMDRSGIGRDLRVAEDVLNMLVICQQVTERERNAITWATKVLVSGRCILFIGHRIPELVEKGQVRLRANPNIEAGWLENMVGTLVGELVCFTWKRLRQAHAIEVQADMGHPILEDEVDPSVENYILHRAP